MSQATDPVTARHYWSTPYAFEPLDGGAGSAVVATTTSARAALVVPVDDDVNVAVIFNVGTVFAYVRLGDSSVVATAPPGSGSGLCSMAVPPGGALTVSITTVNAPVPTHLAAITFSGTTTIQVTMGMGGV